MSDSYDFEAAARRRAGDYADLEVPSTDEPLDQATADRFVIPFYRRHLVRDFDKFREAYLAVHREIDDQLIGRLLANCNWRPRITAAYFAAITCRTSFCTQIGRLLLRSDVCFAGGGYALALARFNSQESVNFLTKYLDHYLRRPDLYYDQGAVMGALFYTDRLNGTSLHEAYLDLWAEFTAKKRNWDLEGYLTSTEANLVAIQRIADQVD